MKIIPAIDIIDGKCVRLEQGNFSSKKIYNENPLEIAKMFEANGIKKLHLVDLDGAKNGHIINWKVLNTITSRTNLKVDFGGGVKSDKDLNIALENGANQITAGSIAIKDKPKVIEWINKYGSNKIILGADAKNGNIAVGGWIETTELPVIEFISGFYKMGISKVISTDISRDGMLSGPAFELYQNIMDTLPGIEIIASGGIATMSDILKLDEMGVPGVITGKAIYENRISLKEIEEFIEAPSNSSVS